MRVTGNSRCKLLLAFLTDAYKLGLDILFIGKDTFLELPRTSMNISQPSIIFVLTLWLKSETIVGLG